MTEDAVTARTRVAIFALSHAKVDASGETKECLTLALTACGDALNAHVREQKLAQKRQHLEVLADALAAPGGEA